LKGDHLRIISAKFAWGTLNFDRLCKLQKGGMKFKKNLLLWNYWANFNQTLLRWSLGGPLLKLCPSAPSCFGHLKKFLFLIMAAILDTGRRWRTQSWKGTT
jgi:hypothetical protein